MGTTESLPEDEGVGGNGYGYDHHDAPSASNPGGGGIPEHGPTARAQMAAVAGPPHHHLPHPRSHAAGHRRHHHTPGSGSSDPAVGHHHHHGGGKPKGRHQRPSPRDHAAASDHRHHHHPAPAAASVVMRGRILGAAGTGKTCLLRRLRGEDPFASDPAADLGGGVGGAGGGRDGEEGVAVIPWRPSVVPGGGRGGGGGGGSHHRGPVVRLRVSDDGGNDAGGEKPNGPHVGDGCHFVAFCIDPKRPETLHQAEREARGLLDARLGRGGGGRGGGSSPTKEKEDREGGGDDGEEEMDALLPLPMCLLLNFRDLVDDDVERGGSPPATAAATAGNATDAKPTSDDVATGEDAPPVKENDDENDGEGGAKEGGGGAGTGASTSRGGGTDDDAVVANGEGRRGGATHLTMADVRAAVDRLRGHLARLRREHYERSLEKCVSGGAVAVAAPPRPPSPSGGGETIFGFESSMRDCYGLSVLHAFLNVPYHAVLGEAEALRGLRAARALASSAAAAVGDEVGRNVSPGGYDDFREGLAAAELAETTAGGGDDGGAAGATSPAAGGDRSRRGVPTEREEESSRPEDARERMERLVEERRALQREAIEQRQRLDRLSSGGAQTMQGVERAAPTEPPKGRSSRRGKARSKASSAPSSSSRAARAGVEDDPQRALDLFLADDSDEAHEDAGRGAGGSGGGGGSGKSRGRGGKGAYSGRGYPRPGGVGEGTSSSDDEDVYYDQEGRRRHALGDGGGGSNLSRLPVMGSNARPSLSSFETRRGREITADGTNVPVSSGGTNVGGRRDSEPMPLRKDAHRPDNGVAVSEAPGKGNNRSLERGNNDVSPDGGKTVGVPPGENDGTSSSRSVAASMDPRHPPRGGSQRQDDQRKATAVEATSSDHSKEGVEPEPEEPDSSIGRDNRDTGNEGDPSEMNRSELLGARHSHAVTGPIEASLRLNETDDGDSDDFIVSGENAVGMVRMRTADAAASDDSDDEFVIGDVARAASPLVPPSSTQPVPLVKETASSAGKPSQPSSSAVSKAALAAIAAAEEEARKAMEAAMLASTEKEKGERKEKKKKKKDKKEKQKKSKKKDRMKEAS